MIQSMSPQVTPHTNKNDMMENLVCAYALIKRIKKHNYFAYKTNRHCVMENEMLYSYARP